MENVNRKNFSGKYAELKKSLSFVYFYGKSHIGAVVIFTVLGASGALVGIVNSLVSRDLVDIITGHRTGELLSTFALMILTQLVIVAINNISSYISTKLSLKVENEIKADLYEKIMSTEWEALSDYHSGDIVSRWSGDVSSLANGILGIIPNLIISIFRFGSAFILVITQDASFAIIAIASVPLSMAVSRINLKRMKKVNMDFFEINAKLTAFTQDSFSNFHNIKALDMVPMYVKKLVEIQKESTSVKLKQQRTSIVNSLMLTLTSILVTYVTYGWGVYRVWSGVITYGALTMFLSISQSLSGSLQNLISFLPRTLTLLNATDRVREIIELPKEVYDNSDEVASFFEVNKSGGIGLQVCGVDFSYKNGNEIMHGVNFEAMPRKVIGLVGPSGEGKTTMLRLLLAIIQPKNGGAFVTGNVTSERLPIKASTRQLFAYVPQGNSMFSGTIADNMRNVKENATDEEIEDALKMACAWEFVSKLPDGINSEVKEHGGGFSEGQSQRLSIARALLRRSPILLLDEATSALDMDTEKRVLDNIMADEYPRTCIITTHRPEVMEVCDRVYSINEKTVSEKKGYMN